MVRLKASHPLFITLVVLLIVAEIVILSPASLEEGGSAISVDLSTLKVKGDQWLAPGIPNDRVPEYGVDQFNYVSTQAGVKQWKLLAKKANFYHAEKIVHAFHVMAHLYDSGGKITLITAREAKFYMDARDLEAYGSVRTDFPDGFQTRSEYLRYLPDKRKVEIPTSFDVEGEGHEEKSQDIFFKSKGLEYSMESSEVFLPKNVYFTMEQKNEGKTVIESDYCRIDRTKQIADFKMELSRPLDQRFVRIAQPRFKVRSRRSDLKYGDFSKILDFMTAYEDVFMQEIGEDQSLRYGTGGRADFDSKKNVIILKEFPQVYQDKDTVTGDVIIVHRDSDIVEVEQSNAFSEGQ